MDSSALKSLSHALTLYPKEDSLKHVIDILPHFSWIVDPEGVLQYCNQSWRAYSGIEDTPEAYTDVWKRIVWTEDWPVFQAWYTDALQGGMHTSPEIRLRSMDHSQEPRWFLLDMASLPEGDVLAGYWLGICTDITARKQAIDRLAEAEEKFQALFNSNVVGIIVSGLGHDDPILDANDVFLNMIGYTRDELQAGKIVWRDLSLPEYDELDEQKVREVLSTGSVLPFEKKYVRKDGTQVPVLVGAARINPDSLKCVNFALDITQQKKIERRKDEFMGMASHELKTPLAVQKLYVHMLSKEIADRGLTELTDTVQKIGRQAEKLDTIVADMLDIVRVEADRIVLNKTVFDPDQLLAEIIEETSLVYNHPSMQVGGVVGASLYGDRERIGQVFTNLISNAVKYSPAGKPIVIHAQQKDGKAEFCVQDFGIGISKEDLPHVFDRFYRVEGASEHTYPGMGVGLFIACDILKRHQGRIWVSSTKGVGSSFYFELPLADANVLNQNSHENT